MDAETLVATVTQLFMHKGAAREVAILVSATTKLLQTDYDNWNGGTYGYTLELGLPIGLYFHEIARRNVRSTAGVPSRWTYLSTN